MIESLIYYAIKGNNLKIETFSKLLEELVSRILLLRMISLQACKDNMITTCE